MKRSHIFFVAVFAVLVTAVAYFVGTAQRAEATPLIETCADTYQQPQGPLAQQCRAEGWTVRPFILVDSRDRLVFERLRPCVYEDGSGGRRPCIWLGGEFGNGVGLSYWIDKRGGVRYFWPSDPTDGTRWSFVYPALADALAEGSAPDATTRDWERCIWRTKGSERIVVRCADGYREVN